MAVLLSPLLVSGRIHEDTSMLGALSGLVAKGGAPAPGVGVVLLQAGPHGRSAVVQRTKSGSDGRFSFRGLERGHYSLNVHDPGYIRRHDFAGAPTREFRVEHGQSVDVATIELVAGSVITGRLATPSGQPVASESISLYVELPDGTREDHMGTQTDDRGVYRFHGLQPGRFTVGAGDRMIPRETYYGGTLHLADAKLIEVGLGTEVQGINLVEPTSHHKVPSGDSASMRGAADGVITGRVVDEAGRPLARATIEARRVSGQVWDTSDADAPMIRSAMTDDRGVYRLWQLREGTYTVSASGDMYLGDRVRSYHPSSSRRTAAEVGVRSGVVAADIDIVFRDVVAPRVMGRIGLVPGGRTITSARVILRELVSGAIVGGVDIDPWSSEKAAFAIPVDEDEYVVEALGWVNYKAEFQSARVKVRVDREDVTGLNLELQPLSRLTGRVELRRLPEPHACEPIRTGKVDESDYYLGPVTIEAWRGDEVIQQESWSRVKYGNPFEVTVGTGEQYRLSLTLSDADVYVVSMEAVLDGARSPGDDASVRLTTFPRDPVRVEKGESRGDVLVVLARGAARVRGRITPPRAGASLPIRARVCLVPADRKKKDDVFHYYEVDVDWRGSFEIRNVAPGDYFMVSRVLTDDRLYREIAPAAWDATRRAQLRSTAEKMGKRIRLSPCQRLDSTSVAVARKPGP